MEKYLVEITPLDLDIEWCGKFKNSFKDTGLKNTKYTKKSNLDQFYTAPEIAQNCLNSLSQFYSFSDFDLLLEPSAGNGSFFNLLPANRLGLDLDPQAPEIQQQDFFSYHPANKQKILTIGNPPFGKNCSLAIKFFNHAAEFSLVIAFIIPKTFQKVSTHNKLDLNFSIKYNLELPKNSFLLNNNPYNVPCCFQIWERTKTPRKIIKISLTNPYFEFVDKSEGEIAVRRVGGRTGKATLELSECAETSHYFLKSKKIEAKLLTAKINEIDFGQIINATAGVKSLSKPEFVTELNKKMSEK